MCLCMFIKLFYIFKGKTALHYAAAYGDHEKVKVLIKGGCNPDKRDNKVLYH